MIIKKLSSRLMIRFKTHSYWAYVSVLGFIIQTNADTTDSEQYRPSSNDRPTLAYRALSLSQQLMLSIWEVRCTIYTAQYNHVHLTLSYLHSTHRNTTLPS